ncbi:RmlC-like cupin [Exidia glandulosa HHB12029]|uniref:RmlC-like cupin n=1 Tax=Exidia glandulosa HHB12029 TaxID=1314781 RepID=A0A165M413_EXIGL|nr:RmlC-like cupin [Exidia glandulosa HHB12029]
MSDSATSSIKVVPRPSHERGNADYGWLKTFHTWNFAGYRDPRFENFGSLRVLNEDRVTPEEGFGTHSHREFEIFSYIVSGELEHRDSMGNVEVMKRGDVQLTSAGTGISHSEKTHGDREVHFLQIWATPSTKRLPPKYYTRHFTDAEKRDKLIRVVAPVGSDDVNNEREGTGPTPVTSPVTLWATILSPGTDLKHRVPRAGAKAYVHVVQTSGHNPKASTGATVHVAGSQLREGDGAFIYAENEGDEITLSNVGDGDAEVLLFDVE